MSLCAHQLLVGNLTSLRIEECDFHSTDNAYDIYISVFNERIAQMCNCCRTLSNGVVVETFILFLGRFYYNARPRSFMTMIVIIAFAKNSTTLSLKINLSVS